MRYKAETWDLMQKNFENFNDHCLHGIIHLNNSLDIQTLQKTITETCRMIPLLTCKFVISKNQKQAWWEKSDTFSYSDILDIEDSETDNQENDSKQEIFITQKIDERKGPQLAMKLFRYQNGSCTLCVTLNHMICDAAGFKQLLYLFCEKYNQATPDKATAIDYSYLQRRRASQVWKKLKLNDFIHFLSSPAMTKSPDRSLCIPFDSSLNQMYPHMILRTIPGNIIGPIIEATRNKKYTINDLILAALCQTIKKTINPDPATSLIIPCPFDQRRYRSDKNQIGICNLVSIVWCNFGTNIGNDISETLQIVKSTMDKTKNNYPGLKGFFLLDQLFKFLSYKTIEEKIKNQFPNPLLGMTNIGIINSKKLTFSGTEIKNVIINGSMKYPPYFQIAFSTFKNQLTISINQHCCDNDLQPINQFLSVFVAEFESFPRAETDNFIPR